MNVRKVFDDIYVSIDIGTTKICVLVAKKIDRDNVQIIGIGKHPSDGLKKGVVVDIAKTVISIKEAVKEAEFVSGHTIETAVIGISGSHINSFNSNGAVPIKRKKVNSYDIANVIAAARAVPIPQGQQILHVLPQYYIIDGQDKIRDPLEMHGVRLESQVHIITGSVASVQNLVRCCEMAGVKVVDIVLEQLASADAVLSSDERELGVAVLDIGGGTSDFALYQNNSIKHTMVLPIAGNHFTNDVAIGIHATINDAERIKQKYGAACLDLLINPDEEIEIDVVNGLEKAIIARSYLVKIIQPRAKELLTLVYKDVEKYNLKPFMTTGLVLTGGGSLLKGMRELAQEIFQVPVRIGSPKTDYVALESLNSPIYATGYGLLLHTIKKENSSLDSINGPMAAKIFFKMKAWVSDFF